MLFPACQLLRSSPCLVSYPGNNPLELTSSDTRSSTSAFRAPKYSETDTLKPSHILQSSNRGWKGSESINQASSRATHTELTMSLGSSWKLKLKKCWSTRTQRPGRVLVYSAWAETSASTFLYNIFSIQCMGQGGPVLITTWETKRVSNSFSRLVRAVHRTPSHYMYSPNLSKAYFLGDLKSISPATTSTNDIPNQQDVYVNSKSKAREFPLFLWQPIKLLNFGPLPPILPIYSSGLSIYRCGRLIPALRVQGRELTSGIASLACQLDRYCFDQPDNRDRCLTPDPMNWDPPGLGL